MIRVRLCAVAVACLLAGAALATDAVQQDRSRQEQLRRMSQDRPDPRCAAEGPGFIWAADARSCVRIGGLVGVQGAAGTSR